MHCSVVLAAILCLAVPSEQRDLRNTLGLIEENDTFRHETDDHYTQGLRIFFERRVAGSSRDTIERLEGDRSARRLTQLLGPPRIWSGTRRQYQPYMTDDVVRLFVGQSMYTPADIDSPLFIPTDRPYAGWLYAGLSCMSYNSVECRSVEVQVGPTGTFAKADKTQSWWHTTIHIHLPQGWRYQEKARLGFNWSADRRRVLLKHYPQGKRREDLSLRYGYAAGNVLDYVNASLTWRYGHNMPPAWGAEKMTQVLSEYAAALQDSGSATDNQFRQPRSGVAVFATYEERAVVYNYFLSNNIPNATLRITRRTRVVDLEWGVQAYWRPLALSWRNVNRSAEFEPGDAWHRYSSIALSRSF